jgi:hypothetical protein
MAALCPKPISGEPFYNVLTSNCPFAAGGRPFCVNAILPG